MDVSWHPQIGIEIEDAVWTTECWGCRVGLVPRAEDLQLPWNVHFWRIRVFDEHALAVDYFCPTGKLKAV